MTDRNERCGLQVATVLDTFVENEALPASGLSATAFWQGFADLLHDFTPRNRELMAFRDDLQNKIDAYHRDHRSKPFDAEAYKQFLYDIGYLRPEPANIQISTANVDPEIASVAGPQLVVPVLNARFALNAANARWGSAYDAFYGTDIIPEGLGEERGATYNPVRGVLVVSQVERYLDQIAPLSNSKYSEVSKYEIRTGSGRAQLVFQTPAGEQSLEDPSQFVGYVPGVGSEPRAILLANHGLHIEIQIDHEDDIGKAHKAGVKDVLFEAALTTIQDCEDSIVAVDAEDKTDVYRNWLGLMKGNLAASFEKDGEDVLRRLEDDRSYVAPDGSELNLPGRSLMLVRNVGPHMLTDAVLDADGEPVYEGLLDALVTALCAKHDLLDNSTHKNSRTGSIYIVKPKMHGPDETQLTCDVFDRVENVLGLDRNTIKIGIMDEERRTSLNLRACIGVARERIVFINTGFLDRTGDEIHTSMYAGAMVRKEAMKAETWINAYEDQNVDAGLETGFPGKAQIGKGMWPKPDEMADMLSAKINHPQAGASCAWVPSPTAATLHALHYHIVNVADKQSELTLRNAVSIDEILKIPLAHGENLSVEEVTQELENNVQSILGYVVRWVDQGIGCSKVPDINDVGLMEDRATCRISSQHVANWLQHGIVSAAQVDAALQKMAAIVDEQNADDESYTDMAPNFDDNIAYQAARALIFEGVAQPNGYTEPILHRSRRLVKANLEN